MIETKGRVITALYKHNIKQRDLNNRNFNETQQSLTSVFKNQTIFREKTLIFSNLTVIGKKLLKDEFTGNPRRRQNVIDKFKLKMIQYRLLKDDLYCGEIKKGLQRINHQMYQGFI